MLKVRVLSLEAQAQTPEEPVQSQQRQPNREKNAAEARDACGNSVPDGPRRL
ncbi:hypothetical protein JOC27_001891 [Sporolactobacillus spathodeae]|uniref:Uncharacterized protein n=1 Tax=Sporolactobacillus spathodeae TaxID=1465502 RepID=A0ABS2Q9N2_9BACL|nr:hypothetical protein [Sporolactobacillus spathodeae]